MAIFFKDTRIVNKVDVDGDGYARSFRIEFDVDSDGPGNYYVKVQRNLLFETRFLLQSDTFAVDGGAADYQGVNVNIDTYPDLAVYGTGTLLLELYNASTAALVQSRWVQAPDFGSVRVEKSADDTVAFADARIGSRMDGDGDGYARSFQIEFDVNSGAAGYYYVKAYLDNGSATGDKFLVQSGTFVVNGNAADYRSVSINADAFADLPRRGAADFRLELYNASTGTLVQNWRKAEDPDLGAVLVEKGSEDFFSPAFKDVRIVNRVDQEGDGYARSLRIEFDVDSNIAGKYYVKLYSDSGLTLFDKLLVQTAAFPVNGAGVDYQGVYISVDAYTDLPRHAEFDFRLELYNADTGSLMQRWRKTDDTDLGGVMIEKSAEDGVTLDLAFKDARIVNKVDHDGDGYLRNFRIEFDVNSTLAGNYYVFVYRDQGSMFIDRLLTRSPTFAVSGSGLDYQGVTIVTDAYSDLPSQGAVDFRLDLHNADTSAYVQSWRKTEDADLGAVLLEKSAEDIATFAPAFKDARIVNRIDQDGDGYASSFRVEFDVDSNIAGAYYVKVYEDDGALPLDDFLVQTATFPVNGTVVDYQGVNIDADAFPGRDLLGHGTAELRLQLFNAATNTPVQGWNLAGPMLVEQSIEDTGNVIVVSGSGNDLVQGGAAADTAVYRDIRANYTFVKTATGFTVTDVTGKDGIDTLESFERIKFSDGGLAFDVSPTQSAGQTALLLGAVLPGTLALHESKQALVGTVIGFFDEGYTLKELSGALMRIPIWSVLTGLSAPTNTDIASYLLTNVLHRAPDAATLAAAVNAIETESFQGEWLAGLALSAESQAHIGLAGLVTSGLAFL